MTDKKLTDEEVVKALECCKDCSINLNFEIVQKIEDKNKEILELIDIINSLKAEIERLKKEVFVARDAYISIQDRYEHTKTEAYKEFAERLNEEAQIADCFDSYNMVVGTHFIDNLLKEMVGEEE